MLNFEFFIEVVLSGYHFAFSILSQPFDCQAYGLNIPWRKKICLYRARARVGWMKRQGHEMILEKFLPE